MNLLVDEGNDLIIGVGFLWGDADRRPAAAANPDTSSSRSSTRVRSTAPATSERALVFAEEQGSFLVGAAAALKSQTGKIGFIGGVENDLIKKFEAGYVAGAEAVNPDIEVEVTVHHASRRTSPASTTRPRARRSPRRCTTSGADVVYAAAGGSGDGVFEAAKEYSRGQRHEVWAIGVDSDQYNTVGRRASSPTS